MNRIEILREKITKLTGLLTDKKVRVTQRGVQACVRYTHAGIPELVNIPFIPDNATQEFVQAIEGFLDHEVAHVLFTSGEIVVKADKLGVGGYHNAVEDIYIEGAMSRRFPGSKINLETMHILFIRDVIDANYKKNKDKPIQYLLVALLRGYSGQRAFAEYMSDKMDIPEIINCDKRLSEYCKKVLPNIKSSQQALEIALEIRRLLEVKKEPPKPKEPPPPQEEPNEEKGEPNKGSGPTPEDEGQSGNSTDEEEENDDKPNNSKGKEDDSDKDDADKSEGKPDDGKPETDDDESSSPSNKEEPDNGSGDDDVDSDGDSNDADANEPDDGDTGDTGNSSDSGDDEQGAVDDADKPESEEDGEPEADGGGKGSGEDTEPEEQPAKDATGEDQADSEGEKTKSEEGKDSAENPSEDESEDGADNSPGQEGGAGGEEETNDEPEAKPEDREDAHQDLDMNASTPDLPPIDAEALQKLLKDFDEAMSELITREAIEVAENSDYLIYTRDFDVIEKFDIEKHGGINADAVRLMEDKVDHMVGKIQRDLERAVSSQNKTQWAAGQRSGRLDTGSLSRLVKFGEEKVFKRKQVTKAKNAALSLLIDCSGSMDEHNKIATAAYTAYALSTTLERLGINHEVLGFTTSDKRPDEAVAEHMKTGVEYSRYDNLYIPIFKPFGERLNSQSKAGLASLATARWLGNNVDGESLAIAASRLSQQKEERKILIVLSDGNPVCYGDKHQIRSHLKKTVKDIIKSKIEVLGIGINDDAVKTYYPKHLVINRLSDLPTVVMGQLRKFLTE